MKAVICNQYGSPESLMLAELPSPRAATRQVVVSVQAAGVNYPDALKVSGVHQNSPPPPFTPGYEVSGIVKEIGDAVSEFSVGDAVVATIPSSFGGYAEEVVVPVGYSISKISPIIDFAMAAAFPLAYGTSWHALTTRANLQAGETLLVLGAAGGVGLAAVQLGKLLGARVIACASSPEKLAISRKYGADALINYESDDLREAVRHLTSGRGIDVVIDPVGGRFTEPAIRGMAWGGRYCVIGFTAGEIPRIALNLPLLKGCSVVGVAAQTFARRNPVIGGRELRELVELVASGKIVPVVSKIFSLADAPSALRLILDRNAHGKLVLAMPGYNEDNKTG